jgi:hypothetical protein
MITFSRPKHLTIDILRTLTRKTSLIVKFAFPSPIESPVIFASLKVPVSISRNAGGMQIDESDEHFEIASLSIRKSLEPVSKVTGERATQQLTELLPRISTDEGM